MAWKVLLAVFIPFALSLIGIVIGGIGWDQDKGARATLTPGVLRFIVLGLVCTTAILVAGRVLFYSGDHDIGFSAGSGFLRDHVAWLGEGNNAKQTKRA